MTHRRLNKAERALAAADPVLAELIPRLGPCRLRQRRARDPFAALVQAIVGQMITGKAAQTIYRRLLDDVLGETQPSAARIAELEPEDLRPAGLSRTKARAIHELARRVDAETLPLRRMGRWKDARIQAALIDIPGIGIWTAQMFLMFHLARPDVFPDKDLGVQEGIRRAYGLDARPKPREAREHAAAWAPYRSTGAWYMWRVLDGPIVLDGS